MGDYCKAHAEQHKETGLIPDLQNADDMNPDLLYGSSPFSSFASPAQKTEVFRHFERSYISFLRVEASPVVRC